MRKQFLFLFLAAITGTITQAQTRGTKVGYIDMEYILENVPDYKEAQTQLDQKAQKWKQEIEAKKNEIDKLKEALKAESPLLTKELIDERETEIKFLENERLDYQQKRFGAYGDLMTQKSALAKPIQDQVFTAVQDIAETKKYDFIFDKSSDFTMLFAAKRFDISDQVLRILNRIDKREQLSKKQLKEEEAKENAEDALDENPTLAERQKALDAKKAARDLILEERKLLQEQKKKEFEDRRKQILAEREAKKNGTVSATAKTAEDSKTANSTVATPESDAAKTASEQAKKEQADARAKTLEERKKIIEERKKALEEKKKKTLEEREALKKANEEKLKEEKLKEEQLKEDTKQ